MSRAREATEPQIRAADPAGSTWLSANAGSGKTRVLIDRVARLLLGGTEPQRILCLTYTKAAASEMQIRLFERLGEWAMLPDAPLRAALERLGVAGAVDAPMLAGARRLFARAIETPGGLKIQTIHSFCAAMLRRFPLESGISPQFVEMDERAAAMLREEVIEELAAWRPEVVDPVARIISDADFIRITAEIARFRTDFARPLHRDGALGLFGLPAGYDLSRLQGEVIRGDESTWLDPMIAALRGGKAADGKLADALARFPLDRPGHADFAGLEAAVLFGENAKAPFAAKINSLPTKDLRARLGAHCEPLHDLMERVAEGRPRRLGLMAAERTHALHQLAEAFLPAYAARKSARGWLDFDDLILKARELLTDPGVAQWVLFKLDGGIDHLLVDEAQDTSPVQWQVIDLLSQEFTAGQGARAVDRTIFVVGDKKQSIYSFQGADLAAFDRMRDHFGERMRAARQPLGEMSLDFSFRSSPAILRLVDLTFDERRGPGLGGAVRHLAYHDARPGRVDLWPVVEPATDPDPGEWYLPVDLPAERHHERSLAEEIAAAIAAMTTGGTRIPAGDGSRALRPGDILILVQRRARLFHEIIRACKAAGLPVAGADRLKLGAEIAVRDLTALLSFLATDTDDLALATALRSPLFGWSEQDLHRLAAGRGRVSLWQNLRQRHAEHPWTHAVLTDLRDQADFLRPYELIERMLTRHDGRRRILARLGPESEDGIDAFLDQALAYERLAVPSLIGFLGWIEIDAAEIKRQPDEAGDQIRVMTVHGAKGLEAPVVFLPDTAERQAPRSGAVTRGPDGTILWQSNSAERTPAQAAAAQAERQRQTEENLRLLYVALTRAEVWLIACAAGRAAGDDCWYRLIESGMTAAGAGRLDTALGAGLRLESGHWPVAEAAGSAAAAPSQPVAAPSEGLPSWARRGAVPAEAGVPVSAPFSPSALGGAKALPAEPAALIEDIEAEAGDEALRHGRRLHLLLEHLPAWPAETRARRAADLLAAGADPGADPEQAAQLLAEAVRVLDTPGLGWLFGPDSLAEVEIAADLGPGRMLGAIDRLIVAPDRILAVDYKSNRIVPDRAEEVPDGILRQMGAYAAGLAQIYPDRRIETAILWTQVPLLMSLPPHLVERALASTSWP